MTLKDNCDAWIKYAYEGWLDGWIRTLPDRKFMSVSAQNMVKRMKEAEERQNTEGAWSMMERIKRMSGSFYNASDREHSYPSQWAEIYMECALVAYKLGDLTEASKLLRDSVGNFYGEKSLHKAVVYWFLGCIQWQSPTPEEAVVSWERSMKIMRAASSDVSLSERCNQVEETMAQAINTATDQGFPNSPFNSDQKTTKAEAPRQSVRTSASSSSMRLGFLPCYGSIPAGKTASLPADTFPDEARINSLEINGRVYDILKIRREEMEVNLSRGSEYFLMLVKGDSMNNASPVKIKNGDYVLLKDTREANNGEIVAAVIVGEDAEATLKRYLVEGSDRFLKYENAQDITRIPLNGKDHYIQGVVIAILKPTDD